MLRQISLFFLVLFVLAGCGGGGSKGVSELSLNNGADPVITSSKSYKPSANLVQSENQLLTNLKKQHYQTEVALIALPEDSAFSNVTDLVGSSDAADSVAGPQTGTISQNSSGTGGIDATTGVAVKKAKVHLKSEVTALMTTVQTAGGLQNYSLSKIDGNSIYFSQYYYYYFVRPSFANDYPAIFFRINDANKTISKVLSDDKSLVFHVYADGKSIGLSTPNGKTIQLVVNDSVTGESTTLELIFEDVSPIKDILTVDGRGVGSTDSALSENTAAPSADVAKGADFTDTNNQVEGVSEADHVKTDGSFIYSLSYNNLKIYDISKGDFVSNLEINFDKFGFEVPDTTLLAKKSKASSIVSDVMYVQYVSSDINLVDGNIVVFSQYGGKTIVSYIDISNKEAPTLSKQLTFNESLVSSRIIDGKVILVMNDYLYPTKTIEIPYHYAFTAEQQTTFTAANEAFVKDLTLADFSMDTSFEKTVGAVTETVSYLDGDKIYFDENSGGYSLSKIIVLDASAAVVSANGVLTDYTENIYVTSKSVFLFNTTWESRIEWWNFEWIGAQNTMIYYFDIQNATLDYKGGIEVTGAPHGTFSFNEKDSNLFMAFHDDTTNDNGIHTISLSSEMSVTNTLSGIATGESLQSVRFIEDKAYLVTFKYIDPLFIVDLSNPTSPTVLGELKVTGFSSYLHLVFDGILLGVGSGADENGSVTGAKINTFNVATATPTEIDNASFTNGYSYFNASYDHHAFTWYQSHNLLALTYSGEKNGAIVYRLDATGAIVEAALIESPNTSNDYSYFSSNSGRIIFVDDTLYYIDGGFIKSYAIDTLTFSSENKNVIIESSVIVEPGDGLTISTEPLPIE